MVDIFTARIQSAVFTWVLLVVTFAIFAVGVMRKKMKTKVHTHRIFFTDSVSKKEKSFTCPKDMLQFHLREVQKMNTNVRYERNV